MPNKKISTEQLEELQRIQKQFDNLIVKYGELNLKKRILESDIQKIEVAFNEVETSRQDIIDRLNAEFGNIQGVNLETGEIEET